MLRIIVSFAAGFVVAKLTTNNKTIENLKETSCKMAKKIQTTSKKVAAVVKDEFTDDNGNNNTRETTA